MRGAARIVVACASCVAALLWSGAAAAQGKYVTPTEEQVSLGQQALEAFVAGDIDKAIERYQASLAIGPLNITYVTLGYAYLSKGACREAVQSWDAVESAPRIKPPPNPAQVSKTLKEYRDQLPSRCGEVLLVCVAGTEASVQTISIDGGLAEPCPTSPLWLPPGEHRVVARGTNGLEAETRFDLKLGASPDVEVRVPDLSDAVVLSARQEGDARARRVTVTAVAMAGRGEARSQELDWTPGEATVWLGIGSAAAWVGLIGLDLLWAGSTLDALMEAGSGGDRTALADYDVLQDEFESRQTVMRVVFGVALGATVATGIFYALDVWGGEEASGVGGAGLQVWDEGAAATFGGRW